MEYIDGKIAAILNKTTVVINRGSRDGVVREDEAYIYSSLGPFFDPDTQENLGVTKRIWGKVIVSIVEERFSIAQTEYNPLVDLSFLSRAFGGARVQLPVKDTDISADLTHIETGSPVIIRKHKPQISVSTPKLIENPEEEEEEDFREDDREETNSNDTDSNDDNKNNSSTTDLAG